MAVGYDYELYVDGARVFYSNSSFNIYCGVAQFADMSGEATGSYTYDEGQYAGWTTIQGSTTPEYAYEGQSPVSDVIWVTGKVYLYSIPATSGGSMYIGNSTISKMYLGNNEVEKVYFGQDLVYEKQASGGGNVTITFTNGYNTSGWSSTQIYDDYDKDNWWVQPQGNNIGSISSANGTTNVTTTTGKLAIYCEGAFVNTQNTITASGGVTNVWNSGDEGASSVVLITADITGDGTITINGVDWDD